MKKDKHLVAVTGIVVKDNKYLITKRASHKKAFPDMWTVPGGNLEVNDYFNEPKDTSHHWYNVIEKVLRREIKEETGLEVKDIRYLTSITFLKNEEPVLILSLFANYAGGEIQLNEESSDFAWVTLEESKKYPLIEGIYEELVMLDKLLKENKFEEWSK